MNHELDLSDSVEFDITVEKGLTLDKTITCYVTSGCTTTGYFSFSGYTGSTLIVKNKASDPTSLLTFSTVDGSIILADGSFRLLKSWTLMNNLQAGKEYWYQMVLTNSGIKRGFLKGNFIVIN